MLVFVRWTTWCTWVLSTIAADKLCAGICEVGNVVYMGSVTIAADKLCAGICEVDNVMYMGSANNSSR